MAATRIPVGELLLEAGVLDRGALDLALEAQRSTGMPLGRVIVSQGFASAETVANVLATQYGRMIRAEFGVRADTVSPEALARQNAARANELAALRARCAQFEADLAARQERIEELEAHVERLSTQAPAAAKQNEPTTRPRPATSGTRAPAGPRLGELLVTKGLITRQQLGVALLESRHTNTLLGRVLLDKGFIFEDELARCLSEQWKLDFISLMRVGVDQSAARLLPKKIGLDYATIPVRYSEGGVTVAFADPSDEGAVAAVESFVGTFTPAVSTLSDITMAWRRIRDYGNPAA